MIHKDLEDVEEAKYVIFRRVMSDSDYSIHFFTNWNDVEQFILDDQKSWEIIVTQRKEWKLSITLEKD